MDDATLFRIVAGGGWKIRHKRKSVRVDYGIVDEGDYVECPIQDGDRVEATRKAIMKASAEFGRRYRRTSEAD